MIDSNLLIKQLLTQCNQDTSLAHTIFDKLFEEVPQQLAQIEQSIHSNDLSAAGQVAHSLHGSIRFCGFREFQEDAKALEIALQQQNISLSQQYFSTLRKKLANLIKQQDKIRQALAHKKSP